MLCKRAKKNKLKEVSNFKNLINQLLSKPHNVNDLCCLLHNPAPVQERVPEAEAEDTADVGDYGEGGVDPGALRHLHRRVEHDLDPAVRVRGQHSAGHTALACVLWRTRRYETFCFHLSFIE